MPDITILFNTLKLDEPFALGNIFEANKFKLKTKFIHLSRMKLLVGILICLFDAVTFLYLLKVIYRLRLKLSVY